MDHTQIPAQNVSMLLLKASGVIVEKIPTRTAYQKMEGSTSSKDRQRRSFDSLSTTTPRAARLWARDKRWERERCVDHARNVNVANIGKCPVLSKCIRTCILVYASSFTLYALLLGVWLTSESSVTIASRDKDRQGE